MTPGRHTSTMIVILVTLAFGGLLVTAALALLLMNFSVRADVMPLVAPNIGSVITAVPTVNHAASLVPSSLPTHTTVASSQPIALANLDVPAPDSAAETPISVQAAVPSIIPGPLVDPALSLFTGPVDVPLEIQIPALNIRAPVLGVGLTTMNAMAAPSGIRPDDPRWWSIFWYRGGGIPGDIGTATFAGHFTDMLGRPAVFAYLAELQIGDLIVVRDKRSGLDVLFIVTETQTYTEQEASDPAVLARVFGSSSVGGMESPSMPDLLSRLTLITCAGAWIDGSFDLRLVVYATRASYPF